MKNRNIFFGIALIIGAVLMIANQFGSFFQFSVWTVILSILLLSAIVESAMKRSFVGMFVSIALLYIIYQKPFHFFYISPWTLIVAAVFAGMGLSMLIKKKPSYQTAYYSSGEGMPQGQWETSQQDNNPYVNATFSSVTKYLHANGLQSGRLSGAFGSMVIYFDNVMLAPSGGQIQIDASFSSITLYVPCNWVVMDNTSTAMGTVNFKGQPFIGQNAPVLTLEGNVVFSGVEVIYVQAPVQY